MSRIASMGRMGGAAACAALVATLAGCASRTPVVVYDVAGEPIMRKRYAKRVAVDHFYRFRSTAYWSALDSDFSRRLSLDQEKLLADLGRPDLVRRPFRSCDNERVDEWVYLQTQRLAQLVGGQLVYEGPLTDYERVLIQYGYPDRARETMRTGGSRCLLWSYWEDSGAKGREFCLSKDAKVHEWEWR